MHKSLKTLFISVLLGALVFAQRSFASQDTSSSADRGNINAMNIDTNNKRKLDGATDAEPANKAQCVEKNQENINTAVEQPACKQFFTINDLVSQALSCLNYIELRNFAATCQKHKLPARNMLMKIGNKWLAWVQGLPPETLVDEVATALTRSPNPVQALKHIVNMYYLQVPYEDRLLDRNPQINNGHATQIDTKAKLRQELHQVSDATRRQELLAQLKTCATKWQPYAVAHTMLRLLKNPHAYIFDIPPTSQLEEQWLAIKIDPYIVQEYLRYVQAARRVLPTIHACLSEQGKAALQDKETVSAALRQAHELYAEVATQFNKLPLTDETFAAEDQLINLYKQYLYDLRKELVREQNGDEQPRLPRRTGQESRNPLILHAAEQVYKSFLNERYNYLLHNITRNLSKEMFLTRKNKLQSEEKMRALAAGENNNNNTRSTSYIPFDRYTSP